MFWIFKINIFICIPFEWTMDSRRTALRKSHKLWRVSRKIFKYGLHIICLFPIVKSCFQYCSQFPNYINRLKMKISWNINWIWEGCLGYHQGLEIIMSLSFNGLLDDNVPKCILVINIYMNIDAYHSDKSLSLKAISIPII